MLARFARMSRVQIFYIYFFAFALNSSKVVVTNSSSWNLTTRVPVLLIITTRRTFKDICHFEDKRLPTHNSQKFDRKDFGQLFQASFNLRDFKLERADPYYLENSNFMGKEAICISRP